MRKRFGFVPLAAVAVGVAAASRAEDTGAGLYAAHCAGCHDSGFGRAPPREALESLSPERVLDSLEKGSMIGPAVMLTVEERRSVSEYVAGRPLSGRANASPPPQAFCSAAPGALSLTGPEWRGWGAGQPTPASGMRRRRASRPPTCRG